MTAATGWATAALSAGGPPPSPPPGARRSAPVRTPVRRLRPRLRTPERRLRSLEARHAPSSPRLRSCQRRGACPPFHRQASLSSSCSPFRCTPPASPLCWWRAARCRCFRGGARAAAAPCPRRSSSSSSHGGAPPPLAWVSTSRRASPTSRRCLSRPGARPPLPPPGRACASDLTSRHISIFPPLPICYYLP